MTAWMRSRALDAIRIAPATSAAATSGSTKRTARTSRATSSTVATVPPRAR
jgi:hypothetical protein